MRYQEKCITCSKQQGLRIYQLGLREQGRTPVAEVESELRRDLDEAIDGADASLTPAELSLIAIRLGEKHAETHDPFTEIKKKNNNLALSLYPDLKKRMVESREPLRLACQLAACGNIIDLGIHEDFDIHATIEKVLREGFRRDDFQRFRETCDRLHSHESAPHLLYICDNAGEIVFDRLFIEELQRTYPRFQITAVVRGRPVLNDATRDDAQAVGLDQIVPVIDNGGSELGTVLGKASRELRDAYANADIIISKGQANYETLNHHSENIFFILKAKCEVIAESLQVELWDAVIVQNDPQQKN